MCNLGGTSMNKPVASVFNRVMAALLDFIILVIVSVFASFLGSRIALSSSPKLKECIHTQEIHIRASHLARENNNQFQTYPSDEFFVYEDNEQFKIINILSDFYLSYIVNDNGDEIGSPDFDKKVPGTDILQKDYYVVSWFNENVLELPKDGESAKNDYFEYQKDGDNIDYSKIGTVASKYVKEEIIDEKNVKTVTASEEMINFIGAKYKNAVQLLYKQSPMVDSNKTIENYNNVVTLFIRLGLVVILFIIIPLTNKNGKTIGKFVFKLSLAKMNEEKINRLQVLPRSIFYLALPVILYFVSNSWIQLAILIGMAAVSLLLMNVTKKKSALHDLISRTMVLDSYYKTTEEILEEAKKASEKKNEETPVEEEPEHIVGFEEIKEEEVKEDKVEE